MSVTMNCVDLGSDEAIISWSTNVTLRRFMIVSGVLLSWIASDLFLLQLASNNVVGYHFYSWTGIDLRRLMFEKLHIDDWQLHLFTAYALPAVSLVALILLDRLVSQGETGLPRMSSWCGAAFIVGGAVMDIAVTVNNSPDLELEGNPYVRVLLDSRHSLTFVYAHALVTQSLYITFFCGLWLGFLRHRRTIASTIAKAAPNSILEFFKAATGGAHLTVRQWLFPLHASEVPHLYYSIWLVAIPVVFGISLFRWYAALEWLGIVEPDWQMRVGIVLHGVISSLILYFVAIWRMSRSLRR